MPIAETVAATKIVLKEASKRVSKELAKKTATKLIEASESEPLAKGEGLIKSGIEGAMSRGATSPLVIRGGSEDVRFDKRKNDFSPTSRWIESFKEGTAGCLKDQPSGVLVDSKNDSVIVVRDLHPSECAEYDVVESSDEIDDYYKKTARLLIRRHDACVSKRGLSWSVLSGDALRRDVALSIRLPTSRTALCAAIEDELKVAGRYSRRIDSKNADVTCFVYSPFRTICGSEVKPAGFSKQESIESAEEIAKKLDVPLKADDSHSGRHPSFRGFTRVNNIADRQLGPTCWAEAMENIFQLMVDDREGKYNNLSNVIYKMVESNPGRFGAIKNGLQTGMPMSRWNIPFWNYPDVLREFKINAELKHFSPKELKDALDAQRPVLLVGDVKYLDKYNGQSGMHALVATNYNPTTRTYTLVDSNFKGEPYEVSEKELKGFVTGRISSKATNLFLGNMVVTNDAASWVNLPRSIRPQGGHNNVTFGGLGVKEMKRLRGKEMIAAGERLKMQGRIAKGEELIAAGRRLIAST